MTSLCTNRHSPHFIPLHGCDHGDVYLIKVVQNAAVCPIGANAGPTCGTALWSCFIWGTLGDNRKADDKFLHKRRRWMTLTLTSMCVIFSTRASFVRRNPSPFCPFALCATNYIIFKNFFYMLIVYLQINLFFQIFQVNVFMIQTCEGGSLKTVKFSGCGWTSTS